MPTLNNNFFTKNYTRKALYQEIGKLRFLLMIYSARVCFTEMILVVMERATYTSVVVSLSLIFYTKLNCDDVSA